MWRPMSVDVTTSDTGTKLATFDGHVNAQPGFCFSTISFTHRLEYSYQEPSRWGVLSFHDQYGNSAKFKIMSDGGDGLYIERSA